MEQLRPRLRGRVHQTAFWCAIPAGAALVVVARRAPVRAAAAIYAVSLIGLFGTSAAYHLGRWSPQARRWMRRLDHSMIFLLIAGTCTPFAVLGLRGWWRTGILAVVWTGAVTGIVLKVVHIDGFRRLGGTLYIALGWAIIFAAPKLVRTIPALPLALIVVGGLSYTLGAVVLLTHRPDPNPRVFGYHEVWHAMVALASLSHWTALLLLMLRAS